MTTQSTKPVSVTELKTFIDAVEFAADEEAWVPSPRQWTRIRSMIDRLEDIVIPPPAQQSRSQQPVYEAPMQLPSPTDGQIRMAPGGLNGMAAPTRLQGPFAQGHPQQAVRAPDVDTSNGQSYATPFV